MQKKTTLTNLSLNFKIWMKKSMKNKSIFPNKNKFIN